MFPSWFSVHHTWSGLDGTVNLHVNSGERSFKLRRFPDPLGTAAEAAEAQYSCHEVVQHTRDSVRMVLYVKADCDSGYVCAELGSVAENVVRAQFGEKARNPQEACTDLYYPAQRRPRLLVARSPSSRVCPLHGRYSLQPLEGVPAPDPLTRCGGQGAAVLSAGCGSANLRVETACHHPANISRAEFQCHAHWTDYISGIFDRTCFYQSADIL